MKKSFFLIAFLLLALFANSQILKKLAETSEQGFLSRTTDSSLFIIRQDYVLLSTDSVNQQEFGRGGREWFGRGNTLAVLAGNSLLMPQAIASPWLTDPYFQPYRTNDTLKPYCKQLSIRNCTSNRFETYSQMADSIKLTNDSSQVLRYKAVTGNNLAIDYLTTDTTGWVILAYAAQDTGSLNLMRYKVQWLNSAEGTIKPVATSENLIGGAYFTLRFATGRMEVRLAGFVVKKPMSWCIVKIEEPKVQLPVAEKQPPIPEPTNLTPVDNKKQ